MGKGPNMYQKARKESTYTQEQAAELLHVSDTTVKAWEQGQRVPDNATVAQMAEVYRAPWLRSERAIETLAELGIADAGEGPGTLPEAVLSHYELSMEMEDGYRRLIQIASDGRIDQSERSEYAGFQQVLLSNIVAGLRLAFCRGAPDIKKARPDAGASERTGSGPQSKNDRRISIAQRTGNVNTFRRRGGASL